MKILHKLHLCKLPRKENPIIIILTCFDLFFIFSQNELAFDAGVQVLSISIVADLDCKGLLVT